MIGMLFLAAIVVWVMQTLLALWQFRRFNRRVKALRRFGRVAIGKSKGRFLAGAIVLLCIDEDCRIIKGELLEGVTVFAKCRPFTALNELNLLSIHKSICEERGLTRQQVKAALNARQDYLSYQELQQEKRHVSVTSAGR
ncbi:MAG: transcriptional regulator GutM [Mitsuokella jalaludinii]|uniref:transcriptional regulator GutM n=1 Tax=Mitsuokella jalaludinii TaxID=187979 RepID=UPI00298CE91D|nr:transcriptional regulator GutM [Mitsuokella jalaludinii]MEE0480824.1 transcriptional regulator GutM [Mitsuokella jalaludinii]